MVVQDSFQQLPQRGTAEEAINAPCFSYPELTNVLLLKPGIGQNIAMYALPIARISFLVLILTFQIQSPSLFSKSSPYFVSCSGDAEMKVLSVENPEQTNVLTLKPGVDENIAMHTSPIARNFLLVLISTVQAPSPSFFFSKSLRDSLLFICYRQHSFPCGPTE